MARAGKTESKPRGSRRYSRTPVTTYYRTEAATGQSPFQKRQPVRNRRKYLLGVADVILILILLIGLIYSLLLNGNPKVTASDNSYHSDQTYAQQIAPFFAGLSSHNKITFNEAGIVKRIQSQFPEVSNVSIELPFLSEQPRVRLLISSPAFMLKSFGRLYLVDLQGLAVSQAANTGKSLKLMTVTDQSGFDVKIGQPVLSSQSASFINTLITQSRLAKVPLSGMTLPAVPLELDIRTTDEPYFVKFYLDGDPKVETGQFLAARHKFALSHITPSQYLDVRVAGRVFYK